MATSDNVTNENSNGFSDGTYDPDIEARLYAEIYYSNETYADDHESSRQNDLAGIVDSAASSSSSQTTNTTDTNPPLQNSENHLFTDNSISFEFTKPNYTAKNWPHGRNPHTIDNRPNVSTQYSKPRRLLALKDLWLPPDNLEENRSTTRESPSIPSENIEPSIVESNVAKPSNTTVLLNNPEKDFLTIDKSNDLNISADCALLLEQVRIAKAKKRTERKEARRQRRALKLQKKKADCILTKPFGGTGNLRRSADAVNSMGITTETSKYKVISKKKKLTMKEAIEEAVEISSDSDTSILEVPVPPKPPPPVIQLHDSDEEHNKSSQAVNKVKKKKPSKCSNEATTPCFSIDSDSLESDDHPSSPRRQISPSKPSEIHDETTNQASFDVASSVSHFEENTLILNCTEIQRGVATLEDIRKNREMGFPGHALSDDSMTESEANNWVSIAAGQTDSRDTEMGSIEQNQKSLWEQLTQTNPVVTESTSERLLGSGSQFTDWATVENCVNASIDHGDPTSTRKRPKETEPRIFGEFNVPEVPKKRKKRGNAKTSGNNSLSDYFFKPMTKEMQAFYNNPWGGENLDVVDIQSKMPRNSSHWMILDADLRGPTSRRRTRPCPRCRGDSHYGQKCPEKPKPPSCCMCGETGHTETRCPGTMCLTCGSKYTTYRPTCNYCCQLFCNMCQGTGHTNENCPDLWRKYHNTTTDTMPVAPSNPAKIMKPAHHLSCCNCGKRGHDMTTCRQLQWSQHFTTPTYVSSYTDGPVYLTSRNEIVRDENPAEYINLVEIPGNSDPPHTEISSSNSTFPFIFECSNFHTATEHELSTVLDTLENVHLEGFLAGRVKPTFLQAWKNSFTFRVQIYRDYNNKIRMKTAASTEKEVRWLDKILVQWFTRRDNERQYLVNDKLLYENRDDVIVELDKKIHELNTVEKPRVIIRKIANCVAERKMTRAPGSLMNNSEEFDKWQQELRLHNQLVMSLYKKYYVKDGGAALRTFRNRVKILKRALPRGTMTPHLYMAIIFCYNELFTFRESEALTAALRKAVPGLEHWNWSDHFPHTISGDVVEGAAIEYEDFRNQSIPQENNFYVDCVPDLSFTEHGPIEFTINGGNECSQIVQNVQSTQESDWFAAGIQNFSSTQESDTFPAGNVTYNVYDRGSKTRVGQKPPILSLTKLKESLLINLNESAGKAEARLNYDEQHFLINLPKKKRKQLRRFAKDAMQSARSSNLPYLKKMAHTLHVKLDKNIAHANDVLMLWREIQVALKKSGAACKQQKSRKPKSDKQKEKAETSANRTYANFVGSL